MKTRNFILFLLAFIAISAPAYGQNDYKVRLKRSDGNGGLIVHKNAASRSAAESAALADGDAGSDTGAVDVEKYDSGEAALRGQATETTLAAAAADAAQMVDEVADATNSSTSTLTGGSTFAGGYVSLDGYRAISVSVRTDQDSASSGLTIKWSDDGTNEILDARESFTVTAANDFTEQFPRRALYYKVSLTNGGVAETSLAIITRKLPHFSSKGTLNNPLIVRTVPTGAPAYVTGQVATSTTAATLLAARSTRRSVKFKNLDATDSVYIGPATVTSANGYKLEPGAEVTLTITTLIQVIASANTPTVAYIEEYDNQ